MGLRRLRTGTAGACPPDWRASSLERLRPVQMAVKAWRMQIARQIMLNGDWMKCAPLSPPAAAGGDTGHLSAPNFSNIPG
ncbi:hypothetical protein CN198_35565 [Sinorhizobium meliloti]|nr:hypothetical protein CN198_35565 [Sinorhizobium meliloti]RVI61784.1 hypothetical protein CN187_29160 [Sinorhizobium meliloti]RVK57554.1 hypothetical protein CN159_35105 [Sinorhizobium meliloti]RVP02199.1 hypothetical protein CN083_30220 [Sinorhizobium meliloti]